MAEFDPALEAAVAVQLVNDILRALCERDGLSVESEVEPGKTARNYELADRLGIDLVQPRRFATGGIIRSNSPGDDSIPAFLSEGCAPVPGELGRWLNQPVPFTSRPSWYVRAWYRADDAARRLRAFFCRVLS